MQQEVGTAASDQATCVSALFEGQLGSRMVCSHCQHTRVVDEPFLDLSLPIPMVLSAASETHSPRTPRFVANSFVYASLVYASSFIYPWALHDVIDGNSPLRVLSCMWTRSCSTAHDGAALVVLLFCTEGHNPATDTCSAHSHSLEMSAFDHGVTPAPGCAGVPEASSERGKSSRLLRQRLLLCLPALKLLPTPLPSRKRRTPRR